MPQLCLQILRKAGAVVLPGDRHPGRNVGLCMCHNRIMGFHVVRSTVPTLYLWPQFTVDPAARVARAEEHLAKTTQYPDKHHYMNQVQKYFFRNEQLRYLQTGQFFRYFSLQPQQ